MRFTPYTLPLLLASIILSLLGWYSRRFRITPASSSFTLFVSLAAAWLLLYAVDISTDILSIKIFLLKIKYLIIPFIPVNLLLLATHSIGQGKWLNRNRLFALLIIPAITSFMAVTTEYHYLFRYDFYVDISGPFPVLLYTNGPWYWLHTIYSYGLILATWILLARYYFVSRGPYRKQALILILGSLPPTILDATFTLGISPWPGYNLAPPFFVFTGLSYAWALFRYKTLDIVPGTLSTILKNMKDAVLILDKLDRLVDFNPAAQKAFEMLNRQAIGEPVKIVMTQWPEFLEACQRAPSANCEVSLGEAETRKDYEMSITIIQDLSGHPAGRLIMLREITERKHAEEALRESEERLRQIASSQREAVWLRDVKTLAVLYVNPAYETIWGQSCESFRNEPTSFVNAVHVEDKDRVLQAISAQNQGKYFNEEYRIIRPDGCIRWVWGRTFPIMNEAGEVYRVLSVVEEITERKRIEQDLSRYGHGMAALYNTSLEINSQSNASQLLQTITSRAALLLGARMSGLYMMSPGGESLELVISHNLPANVVGTRLRIGEGLTGRIAQTGELMMVDDYRTWEGRAAVYEGATYRRVLGVPLKTGGEILGVINITDDEKTGPFSEDEVRLARLFADQAAIAIKNARLLVETNRRAEQLSALNRIGQAITSDLELEQVLKSVSDQCRQVLPIDAFYVAVYDESSGTIHQPLMYNHGQYYMHNPRDIFTMPGLSGEVIQSRKTLYLPDLLDPGISRTRLITRRAGKAVRSYVGVPLIVRDKVVGVLSMQNYKVAAYTTEQIHLFETIATQAAIAIENARLFEEMKHLAITDPLTRLFNRRHFFNLAEEEIERAKRYNRPLSVIMMDIDHFKDVNDTFGHNIGDLFLQAIADQCHHHLRTFDIIGRYGGEEFTAVLPETDLQQAQVVAERLRSAIASIEINTPRGVAKSTVSLGLAMLDNSRATLELLLSCADQALYNAKQSGRNQVKAYE